MELEINVFSHVHKTLGHSCGMLVWAHTTLAHMHNTHTYTQTHIRQAHNTQHTCIVHMIT